ncbi:hypothetical protein IV73_GL000186 [Weissella kandleri]|uniref:Uncharacterized protein n=1 Tax=Weissella kandleri TaxID=1616 RepID=A0A0R2JLM8_9LACO|nr:pyocin knob domain-containing protein [Weissella kandleri]KRN75692.1 hypothetical protein IV73_GL000186 [Weissella kandleri]
MSNKFSAFEFTDEGLKVISDVLANQGKMSIMSFYTFDKVITKQLEYDQIQTNNPKQFKPVGTVTAKPNNTVESRLILDNLDVTSDYSLKSVALVGQYNDINFVLGVIFTNEATTIPKYDGISGQSIALDVSFAISDTSIVTINTQLAGMLTVEDYVALMKYIDSKDALKSDDDKVVHLFNNEKIDGIKTFLNTIIGSVSGNSGTTNRVNTLDLNTSVDLNKMDNGLYLATSLDKTTTNKPAKAGEVYVLVVESYEQRFIDLQTNKQYYRSINGSVYNKWERFFTVSEMNDLNADLVHKTKDESIDGNKNFLQKIIGSITGTSGTAIKLLTGRSIQTNLSSNSATKFDGSVDIKPGVTGTLSVTNGGTGTTTGNAPSASKLSPGRKINGVLFDGSKDINVIDHNAIHKNAALSLKDYSVSLFGVAGALKFHVTDTGVGVTINGNLKNVKPSDGAIKTGAVIPTGVPLPPYDISIPWTSWSGITGVTNRTGFFGFFKLVKGSRDIYYKQQTMKDNGTTEYTPGTLGIDTSGWYPTH